MRRADGGKIAARGYHFQYLVTVERMLDMIEFPDQSIRALHVERREDISAEHETLQQVVDLELEGPNGERKILAQVKSAEDPESARPYEAPALFRLLHKLTQAGEAGKYEIITNKRLTTQARNLQEAAIQGEFAFRQEVIKQNIDIFDVGPNDWHRLGRCRIVRIDENPTAYRTRIRERIRTLRTAERLGTGADASGLMTAYLVDTIFQSASGFTSTRVSFEESKQLISVQPEVVAAAVGRFDWGIPIGHWPSEPTLKRDYYENRLTQELSPLSHTGRTPRKFVLRGPSGIGKSSIVAHYAYNNADSYDFMCWINCENSDSINSSFGSLAKAIIPGYVHSSGFAQPEEVHKALASHPGPWLMVMDNLMDATLVEKWIPKSGMGSIVITTTDSTFWLNRSGCDVAPLEEFGSLKLLKSFFHEDEKNDAILLKLAGHLGHWPLALSMAGAYLAGAQAPLSMATEKYIEAVTPRAIADPTTIPDGYPQTLANAILFAIESLSTPPTGADDTEAYGYILQILFASSYLSENEIPTQLLVLSAIVPPESLEKTALEGPVSMDKNDTFIDDVVRLLRSRSLVQRSLWQGNENYIQFMGDRISLNTITQIVMRSRCEKVFSEETISDQVVRSIYHVNRWLVYFTENDEHEIVQDVLPHASTLLDHAIRLQLYSGQICILQGNLALAYRNSSQYRKAVYYLEQELTSFEMLELALPNIVGSPSKVKTFNQLLELQRILDEDIEVIINTLSRGVTSLEASTNVAEEHGWVQDVGSLCRSFMSHIRIIKVSYHDESLDALLKRVEFCSSAVGVSTREKDRQYAVVEQIDELLLSVGNEDRALKLANEALVNPYNLEVKFRLIGLKAEALIYLCRYDEALSCVCELDSVAHPQYFLASEAMTALNNIGIACILRIEDSVPHFSILTAVLEASRPRLQWSDTYGIWLHYVFESAYAMKCEDRASASIALQKIFSLPPVHAYGVRADIVSFSVLPRVQAWVEQGA